MNNYEILAKNAYEESKNILVNGTKADLIKKLSELNREGFWAKKVLNNGKAFELSYRKEKVQTLFTLSLMFFKDPIKGEHDNLHKIALFSSREAAEDFLLCNWFSLHEYWVNTACIEKIEGGNSPFDRKSIDRTWYYTENMTTTAPRPIDEPKCFKNHLSVCF